MFFLANRAKNQMKKKGDGGLTEDGAQEPPQEQQTSSQPATYGTDSRYSIGNMMARVGAAQAGQPLNTGAAPQIDRSAMVQRVLEGPATTGPAASNQQEQSDNSASIRAILARISQRNAGY